MAKVLYIEGKALASYKFSNAEMFWRTMKFDRFETAILVSDNIFSPLTIHSKMAKYPI